MLSLLFDKFALIMERKVGGLLLEDSGDSSTDSGKSSRFWDALSSFSGKVVFKDSEEERMKSRMTPKRVLREIVRVLQPLTYIEAYHP